MGRGMKMGAKPHAFTERVRKPRMESKERERNERMARQKLENYASRFTVVFT